MSHRGRWRRLRRALYIGLAPLVCIVLAVVILLMRPAPPVAPSAGTTEVWMNTACPPGKACDPKTGETAEQVFERERVAYEQRHNVRARRPELPARPVGPAPSVVIEPPAQPAGAKALSPGESASGGTGRTDAPIPLDRGGVRLRLLAPPVDVGQKADAPSAAETKAIVDAPEDCAGQAGHNFAPCPEWQRVSQEYQSPGGDAPGASDAAPAAAAAPGPGPGSSPGPGPGASCK